MDAQQPIHQLDHKKELGPFIVKCNIYHTEKGIESPEEGPFKDGRFGCDGCTSLVLVIQYVQDLKEIIQLYEARLNA